MADTYSRLYIKDAVIVTVIVMTFSNPEVIKFVQEDECYQQMLSTCIHWLYVYVHVHHTGIDNW